MPCHPEYKITNTKIGIRPLNAKDPRVCENFWCGEPSFAVGTWELLNHIDNVPPDRVAYCKTHIENWSYNTERARQDLIKVLVQILEKAKASATNNSR